MDRKLIKQTPIPLINLSSGPAARPDKHQNIPYTPFSLAEDLLRLQRLWVAVKKKPKRLLIVSSKGIQGLITFNENSFQLTLNEGFLLASTDERFQFQAIPSEIDATSVCLDTSRTEKPS